MPPRADSTAPRIRPARPADFESELRLNAEFVQLLSPLDLAGLRRLDELAAYHHVAEAGGAFAGFLLALSDGAGYESLNYRWFAARYPRFLYIDRVAIARAHQGRGLASALYRDIFGFARRSGCQRVTCEYDREPRNEASARFHARFGFREVGTLSQPHKVVSLQEALVAPPSAGDGGGPQ